MRADGVVVAAPPLNEDLRLGQRVERLGVEQFVPELVIEALHVAVLPGTAGLDERRLRAHSGDPALHGGGGELGVIVGPHVAPGCRAG